MKRPTPGTIPGIIACILAGAALAVSLTHAGPRGLRGTTGVRGPQGVQGQQGPAGPAGQDGQTPYTSYDQVCWTTATNQQTGVTGTYYYPCTNNVSINPQP